jgi:hypothetical protein
MYIVVTICLAGTVMARTIYVDALVAATGDGSLATPFKTIGEAIAASVAGDEIRIAGGIYENEPPYMALKSQQTISGSYDSTFTSADFAENPTIIDMGRLTQQEQNRTFRCQAVASFTIENLVIRNSSTGEWGNTTNGGAIYIQNGSSGVIRKVSFINCHAKFEGGVESGPARDGGAVCIRDASTVAIEDCVFDGCTAVGNGGAICMRNAGAGNNVTIRRCLFTNCGSRNGASAIHDGDSPSQIEIVNCIFANNGVNVVVPSGIAPSNYEIRIGDRRAAIYNCTFVGSNNPDGFMFDVRDSSDGAATKEIINCIVANNTIASGGSVFAVFGYTSGYNDATTMENNLFFSNSDLDPLDPAGAGLIGVTGNIAGDPLFTDAANGDYHLDANSPGVDAGQTLALVPDDFVGTPRPVGPAYDIGALEGQSMPASYNIRNIIATASSSHNADMGPEKTVDGSGLSALGLHDTTPTNMWMSSSDQEPPVWIQYEFDTVYKLDQMVAWNSNNELESLIGLGVKTATVGYSTDGDTWVELTDVPEFTQAPGAADYANDTVVDFNGVIAKFVRITCTSNWGGRSQYGLSEVRFSYIPVMAQDPSPADGAKNIPTDTTLTWQPGGEAAMHHVYFSTDINAVAEGTALVDTVTDTTYTVGPLSLGTTYYWRIDEVNEAATPSVWQGPVWSFTTKSYVVVEDFEAYTNELGAEIFATWADGYEDPANGSQVGHESQPYAERSIIHGGSQSMPLYYGMGNATRSEASRTFAPAQDWAASGANTLTLYVRGQADNVAGQFYVKVNGVAKAVAVDFAAASWQEVNIELASLGINLKSVTSLAISIEGAASGRVFVDDIRLRP